MFALRQSVHTSGRGARAGWLLMASAGLALSSAAWGQSGGGGGEPTPGSEPQGEPEIVELSTLRERIQNQRQRDQQGEDPREDLRDRDLNARERARTLQERRNQILRERGLPVPGEQDGASPDGVDGPGVEGGDPGALDAEGMIELDFGGGAINLGTLIDYVARRENINISADPGVRQQSIELFAPVEIPADELIPLLAALVDTQGFALTVGDLGWYEIKAQGQVRPQFGGEFATTRIIPTPLVRASAVQNLVTTQLGSTEGLRLSAIDEANALLVTGSPGQLDRVQALVDSVVEQIATREVHVFPLVEVSAEEAKARILQLQNQGFDRQGAQRSPQGNVQTPQVQLAGGALQDLGARLQVGWGNTLFFTGSVREAARVSQLVEIVDVVSTLPVRLYVGGPSALQIAQTGERLGLGTVEEFGAGQGARRVSPGVRQGVAGVQGAPAGGGGSRFIVNQEEGTIIYEGTPAQQSRVEDLVDTFTSQALGQKESVELYRLEHADAEEVADLLLQVLEDPEQTQTSPFLPGAGTTQGNLAQLRQQVQEALGAEGEGEDAGFTVTAEDVVIVAYPSRNAILIRASARQQRDLAEVIARLDTQRPQVYIEAQIVSVTSSNNFDWAVETQINAGQFLLFSNFGLGAFADGADASSVRQVPTGTSGITTALVKSDYVPFILNALEDKSDQTIVSSPSILVNDNAEAVLNSIRQEPFSATSQTQTGTITSQGGTAEAGTILTVTPQISAGGYVNLEYAVELSDFDLERQQQGLQPPTTNETYESEVSVPGDMTIVVGGFTFDRDSRGESQIPLLGDIPLIGNLFKRIGTTRSQTTIFVFITPRIVYEGDTEKLLLLTEGPLADVGMDPEIPALEPVVIPVDAVGALRERVVPESRPPSGVLGSAR